MGSREAAGAEQIRVRQESRWVSEYDYERRIASLTLCNGEKLVGRHYSSTALSAVLSDPGDLFQVFVARTADDEARFHPDDGSQVVVKIVAALDEEGALLSPHPDFNHGFIGSFAIWPYKVAGGVAHWLWWSQGWPFNGEPRSWSDAVESSTE